MADEEKVDDFSKIDRSVELLVVDDDSDMRNLVKFILGKAGFTNIVEAADAKEGIDLIENGKVDLVLLDWQMPEVSGIELLKWARAYDIRLPIVMMTAQGTKERVQEALEAGSNDYIVKPFQPKVLVSKIEEVLWRVEHG